SLSLQRLLRLPDALFHNPDGAIGLFFVNDKRRRYADGILAGFQGEQTPVERADNHFVAQVRSFLLGGLVADDLHADHEAFAANVADNLEAAGPVIDLAEDVLAHFLRVGHQAALD